MERIIKTPCPEQQRPNFLPSRLGQAGLCYEFALYGQMDEACKAYTGGVWEFCALSNGGFYIELTGYKMLSMVNSGNYYAGVMSADAASIAANLMVQNSLTWKHPAKRFTDYFYSLRDYALEHSEAREIIGFID